VPQLLLMPDMSSEAFHISKLHWLEQEFLCTFS
jgi:hypothetical protein